MQLFITITKITSTSFANQSLYPKHIYSEIDAMKLCITSTVVSRDTSVTRKIWGFPRTLITDLFDLNVPTLQVVKISFLDFEVEKAASDTNTHCTYDKLVILDYENMASVEYCGSVLPPAFTSSGRQVAVTFSSDIVTNEKGIWATVTFVDPTPQSMYLRSLCVLVDAIHLPTTTTRKVPTISVKLHIDCGFFLPMSDNRSS